MNQLEPIILYNGISENRSYVWYANMAYRETMEEDMKQKIQQMMILPMSPQDLTILTNSRWAALAQTILDILSSHADKVIYSN